MAAFRNGNPRNSIAALHGAMHTGGRLVLAMVLTLAGTGFVLAAALDADVPRRSRVDKDRGAGASPRVGGLVIDPGLDILKSVALTEVTLSSTGDIPPIPAGFFAGGSQMFEGTIPMRGVPVNPDQWGAADTVVRRTVPVILPPILPGPPTPVPVEIIEMQLVSIDPIVVPGAPEPYIVELGLANPSPGQLMIQQLSPNGGFVLDSFFDIDYRIEFIGFNSGVSAGLLPGTMPIQVQGVGQTQWTTGPGIYSPPGTGPNFYLEPVPYQLERPGAVVHTICPPPPPPDDHATWREPFPSIPLTSVSFGTGATPAMPTDFFGPGSDPFTGDVTMNGSPLGTGSDTSVRLQRTADPMRATDPPGPYPSVPIEIVELSLVSASPIIVTYGGANPEPWEVRVGLSSVPAPMGQITATKTHPNGGVFDSSIFVQPQFTFRRYSDGLTKVYDTGNPPPPTLPHPPIHLSSTGDHFVHNVDPTLGFVLPPGVQWVSGIEESGGSQEEHEMDLVSTDSPSSVRHVVCPPYKPPPPPHHATWFGPGFPDTEVNFGTGAVHTPPIPAGFFDPGSLPFEGIIRFDGLPFNPQNSDSSTTIRLGAQPVKPTDPVMPGPYPPIEIEIVALSLTSVDPISVAFDNNNPPELWRVEVDLSVVPSPVGLLTATKTHANGGTFDTLLPVSPRFTFTRLGDNAVRVLDTGLRGIPPVPLSSQGDPWVHSLHSDLDDLDVDPTSTWIPGVEEVIPGDPSSQEPRVTTVADLDIFPTPVKHIITPPKKKVCLYDIVCAEGDCSFCPFPVGSVCRGAFCPNKTCAVLNGLTAFCPAGSTTCCIEFGQFDCKVTPFKTKPCPPLADCICEPPPPECVLPPTDFLCGPLHDPDCASTDPTQTCLPKVIFAGGGVPPFGEQCECYPPDADCGPVSVTQTPIPNVWDISCDPQCPPGEVGVCQIHLGVPPFGTPTGFVNMLSSMIAAGTPVYCDCVDDPPPTVCPEPAGSTVCSKVQNLDCLSSDPAMESCLPSKVQMNDNGEIVGVICDCYRPDGICGPVHSGTGPLGPELFCDPDCPVGLPDPCQIILNGVPTGMTSIPIGQMVAGDMVICDCPPVPLCPQPMGQTLCDNVQATDCQNANPGEDCLATLVQMTAVGPQAVTCDCIAPTQECGPVHEGVDAIGQFLFCDPVCPMGLPGPCQIIVNGNPTGMTQIYSSTLQVGDSVICDCPPVTPPCPEPQGITICAPLQAVECANGQPGELCEPLGVSVDTMGIPHADQCDCFPPGTDCGPVHVSDDGVQLILTCDPTCPPGVMGVCQLIADGVPTGLTTAPASMFPGQSLICDCPPQQQLCPEPPGQVQCAALQATDCVTLPPSQDTCLPKTYTNVPGALPTLSECDCFTGGDCGPVLYDPAVPGYRCLNSCPVPPGGICQIHINGVATGVGSMLESSIPAGASVTCGCPTSGINPPVGPTIYPHNVRKNRFVTFVPNNGNPASFRIRHVGTGETRWILRPAGAVDVPNRVSRLAPAGAVMPLTELWLESEIHVAGCLVSPVQEYEIEATSDGIVFTPPLSVGTILKPGAKFWADTNGPFVVQWSGPDLLVNFTDVSAAVQAFQNQPTKPHVTWVDLVAIAFPGDPNLVINFADINGIINGFQGNMYPGTPPLGCP